MDSGLCGAGGKAADALERLPERLLGVGVGEAHIALPAAAEAAAGDDHHMLLLQKAHIGEVQASVWPDWMNEACEARGIHLL